ncbi:MAG: hypothetical protein PF489_00240, partial [Salinivirgaceae bacterium]|nr:hypothetical protein [Salinivirgaceae bacterium]
ITNLFVFDNTLEKITLKSENRKLKKAKNDTGHTINFEQVGDKIVLDIPKNKDAYARVYKLIFN